MALFWTFHMFGSCFRMPTVILLSESLCHYIQHYTRWQCHTQCHSRQCTFAALCHIQINIWECWHIYVSCYIQHLTLWLCLSLCDVWNYQRQQCMHSCLIQYHTTARWQCLHLHVMLQDGIHTRWQCYCYSVSLSSSVSTSDVTGLDFFFT